MNISKSRKQESRITETLKNCLSRKLTSTGPREEGPHEIVEEAFGIFHGNGGGEIT